MLFSTECKRNDNFDTLLMCKFQLGLIWAPVYQSKMRHYVQCGNCNGPLKIHSTVLYKYHDFIFIKYKKNTLTIYTHTPVLKLEYYDDLA